MYQVTVLATLSLGLVTRHPSSDSPSVVICGKLRVTGGSVSRNVNIVVVVVDDVVVLASFTVTEVVAINLQVCYLWLTESPWGADWGRVWGTWSKNINIFVVVDAVISAVVHCYVLCLKH